MQQLSKGGNVSVAVPRVRAVLGWASAADADASALLLTAAGRVRSDADFVFYNQPASPEGSVRHAGKSSVAGGTADAVEVDLDRLPADVDRVVLAASIDGTTFGTVPGLHLRLADAATGADLARFDIPDAGPETAFVFGELYRRAGAWKLRAVGQGYGSGLAGLATDFGISVDDDAAAPAPAPAAYGAPAPAAPSGGVSLKKQRQVDLEKRASAQAPQLVSLVKSAAVSLDKKGLGEHTARVALCLDISGSMHRLFTSGRVQQLVERVLALALRFDDDGQVDVFLFGGEGHAAGTVDLGSINGYVQGLLGRFGLEPATHYARAMRLVREHYFGHAGPRNAPMSAPLPVYAMFVTDGRTMDERETREQVQASSFEPLFWQFMAIGKSSRGTGGKRGGRRGFLGGGGEFAFLESLDDMPGRYLDNADFFSVEDPAAVPDDQVFDLMVNEYPGWIAAARGAGLLPPS